MKCVVSCLATSALVWDGKPDLQLCCCQDFWSIGSSSQSLFILSSRMPHFVPSWPTSLLVGFLWLEWQSSYFFSKSSPTWSPWLIHHNCYRIHQLLEHPGHPTHNGQLFFIFITTPEGHVRVQFLRILISFQSGTESIDNGQLDLLSHNLPSWQSRSSWSPWSTLTGRRRSTSP